MQKLNVKNHCCLIKLYQLINIIENRKKSLEEKTILKGFHSLFLREEVN